MAATLTLLDELIKEHRVIRQGLEAAMQVANDAGAIFELAKAKQNFVPGRLADHRRPLQDLQKTLDTVEQGLNRHFEREEKALLVLFQEHGSGMLTSALRILLLEHKELKDRITESKKEVAELVSTRLPRELSEGRAWGVRVYISHTQKLMGAHAHSEEELFQKLRDELTRK